MLTTLLIGGKIHRHLRILNKYWPVLPARLQEIVVSVATAPLAVTKTDKKIPWHRINIE
jgi:hypothetical protein